MRWFWIDRFVEFESGRRAVAEKAVTLAEEELDDYVPGFPVYPASLLIEGFAQTGGLLVGEHRGFRERTVLAKVGKAKFHFEVRPGDTIRFEVTVEDLQSDGSIVRGASYVAGQLQAEVEIMFAYLLAILRLLGVYDVGRKPDGTPLEIPTHLLEAERAADYCGK